MFSEHGSIPSQIAKQDAYSSLCEFAINNDGADTSWSNFILSVLKFLDPPLMMITVILMVYCTLSIQQKTIIIIIIKDVCLH